MLQQLKDEANRTYTENGAATWRSTGSANLDLFATIGALRRAREEEVTERFLRAYAEQADLAMKTLFFARDIRGGLGERRTFRTILRWLAFYAPQSVEKNIPLLPEYGRYDDLLILLDTPCETKMLTFLRAQLETDCTALRAGRAVSLLAKWLPSVNASNGETVRQAKRLARAFGMPDARYRKTLSALRARIRILENNLRERDYTFDYAAQPSRAMLKYRKAFLRNDGARYRAFLERVAEGAERLHTGALAPYEIIAPLLNRIPTPQERRALDATWNAQEDFTGGERALVVIDGSGSMYGGAEPLPAAVALSLGIYYAERNVGAFHNHFITFSENPQLVEIQGADLFEKVRYCSQFDEVANTNIQRVFALILDAAVKHQVPQEQMPARLYIISDMEFDACTEDCTLTNLESARRRFEEQGYRLPELVFWNVDSRNRQQPVTVNDRGVALVSGCSSRVFSLLRSGCLSPEAVMMDILGSERYAAIAA